MWPFTRKYSLEECGIIPGGIDWHCHVLPGVDDGIRTMEDSLRVLAEYERQGIREVWLTPHIMEDIPNAPEDLHHKFAELQLAYQGPIRLHLAAENMLDNLFEARMAQNDILSLGEKGDHVLVETSYFNPPMGLHDLLRRICSKGYYPILAHPERYVYMNESDYAKLLAEGVKFQLNILSLTGAYGADARQKAIYLLTHTPSKSFEETKLREVAKTDDEDGNLGCYTVAGSDLHSLGHWLHYLYRSAIPQSLAKRLMGWKPNRL